MRSSPSCCSSSLPTSNSPHDPPTVRLVTSYQRTIRGTPSAPGAAVENCGGTRASVDTVAPHAEVESHKISHAFSINALLFAHTTPFVERGRRAGAGATPPGVRGRQDALLTLRIAQTSPRTQRHSDLSRVVVSETPRGEREKRPDRRRRAPAPGRSQSRSPHLLMASAMTTLPCRVVR